MIPKIIHCCWLSGGAKDALSRKCRRSWERIAPECEIREWTLPSLESVEAERGLAIPAFVREAVSRRKWPVAADWVRFAALYLDGGVYFDYDFELLRPIDDLLAQGPFVAGQWMPDGSVGLEPAILALEKGSPIAKAMLDHYATAPFDGYITVGTILAQQLATLNQPTAPHPPTTTPPLTPSHYQLTTLHPEVFSPIDVRGVCHRTASTRGIHHYAMSWASPQRRLAKWLAWHGMRNLVELLLAVKGK